MTCSTELYHLTLLTFYLLWKLCTRCIKNN